MDIVTVLSLVFVLVGAAMSVAAGRRFVERRAFLRHSEVATGEVIALVESRESEDHSFFPTVRFRTSHGSQVTFESEAGSNPDPYHVGDLVRVRHRRDQPQKAEIETVWALWGPAVLFGLLGLVFLCVGLGILTGVIPVSPAR